MPNSQENEPRPDDLNIVLPEIDWEGMAEAIRDMAEAFRAIRPQLDESFQRIGPESSGVHPLHQARLINEVEDMAVDIRHGEYPRRDGDGTYWYDPSTLHTDEPGICFMCKAPTHRLDIDYHGHFCGSDECNEAVVRDLERLNGGPENG
ncbi:hypothetical protein SEA_DAUBENSKI_238 [Streptomyces phage Daubenski]|uniref:Uncharacterized protein n=1 Tax=Streptomyces phage Daubenski TaxID=2653725 RepID=A0A5Q2WIZ2_9CAUD|nr:hypothetical protein KNU80_gp067 [Streptomyces phage Daubenski]QGH76505.1 hypothetical protein SEA_DAUBENSKI_238 [Streptomyces phage Daubenski]